MGCEGGELSFHLAFLLSSSINSQRIPRSNCFLFAFHVFKELCLVHLLSDVHLFTQYIAAWLHDLKAM